MINFHGRNFLLHVCLGQPHIDWSIIVHIPIHFDEKNTNQKCDYGHAVISVAAISQMALEMGVTPPHLRTSYNLFFLEEECIGSWKRMVVSLSSW